MSNCLQLDHVDYAYGAAKIRVLSDVSADFESGKISSFKMEEILNADSNILNDALAKIEAGELGFDILRSLL